MKTLSKQSTNDEDSKIVPENRKQQPNNIIEIGARCDYIGYIDGHLKLYINDYSFLCNRTYDNVFFWQCDYKDCISQAVTMLINKEHWLKSLDDHCHETFASKTDSELLNNELYEKCEFTELDGISILIRNGYFYKNTSQNNQIHYWECNDTTECNARLITILTANDHYVKFYTSHNHNNNYTKPQQHEKILDSVEPAKDFDNSDDIKGFKDSNYDYEIISNYEDNGSVNSSIDDIEVIDDITDDPLDIIYGDVVCDLIVKTNEDLLELTHNNYKYIQSLSYEKICFWNCEHQKLLECNSIAVTEIRNGVHYLKKHCGHNHSPRIVNTVVKESITRINDDCIKFINMPPEEIVKNELKNLSEPEKKLMPAHNVLVEIVNRKRSYENVNNNNNDEQTKSTLPPLLKKARYDTRINVNYEACEVIPSIRGNKKLIIKDCVFTFNRIYNERYYWFCDRNKPERCTVMAITVVKNGSHLVTKLSGEHNHEINPNRKIVEKIVRSMKEKALKSNDFPSKIFEDLTQNLSEDIMKLLPKKVTVCRTLNRIRVHRDKLENKPIKSRKDNYACDDDIGKEVDVFPSIRGNKKLIIKDCVFTFNRIYNERYYWFCDRYKPEKCSVMAITVFKNGAHYLRKLSGEHRHEINPNRKIVERIIRSMKDKALNSKDFPSKIYEELTQNLSEEIIKLLPKKDAACRTIHRIRLHHKRKINELLNLPPLKTRKDNFASEEIRGKPCEVITSVRGNNKLIVSDCMFTLNRLHSERYYWACDKAKSDKCTVMAVTNYKNGAHHLLKLTGEHMHEINPNRKIVDKLINSMKERALNCSEYPSTIFENFTQNLDEDILKLLPTKNAICRSLNRVRAYHNETDEIYVNQQIPEELHIYEVNINVGSECNVFTPTNKGNLKLNLDGYFYHKNRIKDDLYYWQCDQNRIKHCRGFATTCVDATDGKHYMKRVKNHNHPPENRRHDIADILLKIKQIAKSTDTDPTIIYNCEIANLSDDLKEMMPQRSAIITMINRTRRKTVHSEEQDSMKKIEYDEEQEHIFEVHKNLDDICELVPSVNNLDKLLIDGFTYSLSKVYNDLHKWKCDEQRDTANCRGYATTILKNDGNHYFKTAKNHNHPCTEYRDEIMMFINKVKERAQGTRILPNKIYDDEIEKVSKIVFPSTPPRESILTLINRVRRRLLEDEKATRKSQIKHQAIVEDHFHEPFVEIGSEVYTVTSHKGTNKLNLNGYLYVKNVVKKNIHYWQCDERNLNHCRGHATTSENPDGQHYLRTTRPHNHLAKLCNHQAIADVMNQIKDISLITNDGPKKIYDDIVETLPKEIKSTLPNLQAIAMVIKRHRRKYRPLDRSGLNQSKKIYSNEIAEVIDRMKQKILTTSDGPAKIYNSEVECLSSEICSQLPKRENILQILKRTRRTDRRKREQAMAEEDEDILSDMIFETFIETDADINL